MKHRARAGVPRLVRLRLPPVVSVVAVVALTVSVHPTAPSRAQDGGPRSWVGTWWLHEPDHGSYRANELRLQADGRLERTYLLDTAPTGPRREPRVLGGVVYGAVFCRPGTRWRAGERANELIFEGDCRDGRPRDIVYRLPEGFLEERIPSATLRAVRVGRFRGPRLAGFERQELVRCGTDPDVECGVYRRR